MTMADSKPLTIGELEAGLFGLLPGLRRLVADERSQERIQRTHCGTICSVCMTVCPSATAHPSISISVTSGPTRPACRLTSDLGANRDYRPMTCLVCMSGFAGIGLKYWSDRFNSVSSDQ